MNPTRKEIVFSVYRLPKFLATVYGGELLTAEAMFRACVSSEQRIPFNTTGGVVIATLQKHGAPVRSGIAICSLQDRFDVEIGKEIALERLYSKEDRFGLFAICKGSKFVHNDPDSVSSEYVVCDIATAITGRYYDIRTKGQHTPQWYSQEKVEAIFTPLLERDLK